MTTRPKFELILEALPADGPTPARRLAAAEPRRAGVAYRRDLGRVRHASKSALIDKPGIDTRKLCVPCTITTQDEDREDDVIVTAGIDLSNHRNNPVVLLDHGFPVANIYPAVAKAMDPEGVYQVTLEARRGRSVSWFSEKIQASYQTFALIEEGFLNGVSIGLIPTSQKQRAEGGLLIARCQLLEYSHCPIGINQHALADRIGKGMLGTERISPAVWQVMSSYLPMLKSQVTGGYGPPRDPGAQVLAGAHTLLSGVAATLAREMPRQENHIVRAALGSLAETVQTHLDRVEEVFTQEFPGEEISVSAAEAKALYAKQVKRQAEEESRRLEELQAKEADLERKIAKRSKQVREMTAELRKWLERRHTPAKFGDDARP